MVDAYPATQQASLANSSLDLSPPTHLYLPPTEEHPNGVCQHREYIGAAVAKGRLAASTQSEHLREKEVRKEKRKGENSGGEGGGRYSQKKDRLLSQIGNIDQARVLHEVPSCLDPS
jgi:hypothetical protein